MPFMYEYSEGYSDGKGHAPGVLKRDVKSLGAKMVTLADGYRYEHRGRFKPTFQEAQQALVADLEKQCDGWRKYLAGAEARLAAARALTDGVSASAHEVQGGNS